MNHPQMLSSTSFNPIADMQFSGLHWIEASAGTGKTFTLSSLMVRIFLGSYLPNQVIATTFTRKAAAELKSRIRARLLDTLHYFEDCQSLTEAEINAKIAVEGDPLFQKVLSDYAMRVDYARSRLKLVMDQLDELFVGTLDSFSQKLLREFSFESGKIERADITDDAKAYSAQLIHDVLREWIQLQPQKVVDYLLLSQKLKSADSYIAVVDSSLSFSSAQLQPIDKPSIDINKFENLLGRIAQIEISKIKNLEEYYLEEGQYYKLVNKKAFNKGRFTRIFQKSLPKLINELNNDIHCYFDSTLATVLSDIRAIFLDSKGKLRSSVFNTCPDAIKAQFYNDPVLSLLQTLVESELAFNDQLDELDSYIKYYLAQEVKKRLPQVLQQKSETTFAQQIRTLADALQGQQGQRFAQFVHSHYPLILVDEFQDTNQDQDDMLARIWRDAKRYQQGCMIMVGDPKQAIYGFRGGDMLTYNKAHADVLSKRGQEYSLGHNHRSVKELVQVVDALFQRNMDFGEQVHYSPVEAGTRSHSPLIDAQGTNHQPLRWILLQDKKAEAIQVAWKIRDLLNQANTETLYLLEKDTPQYVLENDIAILSKNHDGLDKAQYELERLGIRVNRPSKRSVFDHQVAKDVAALLSAILHPYDEGKIKRALLSRLLGFNLQQLMQLEAQADGLSQFIYDFDCIREMWLEKGFLTAWHYCLNLFQVWKNLVATQSRDNERSVVNLRHLNELLGQHSEQQHGAQKLYHWYLKQLQSPAEREWELERKLSNEAGVQLMTIHQSKGLEFKIVFLLGADKSFKEMNKTLNFSTIEQVHAVTGKAELQRVVAVNDKNLLAPEAIEQHNARAVAEQHRLWYVALTRASHRVYAVLHDLEAKSEHGLAFWRGQAANLFVHAGSADEPVLSEKPHTIQAKTLAQALPLQAMTFPAQRFYPRTKTSFSALAQHLSRKQVQDALALSDESTSSAADEIHLLTPVLELTPEPISWIKRHFPMGTVAGTFLHEIFEHIDFQQQQDWPLEIRRRFKNDYPALWTELLGKYQQEFQQVDEDLLIVWMGQWLAEVLATPLHQAFQLNKVSAPEYLAEFPFYLALSDHVLAIQRIHALYAEYGIAMLDFNAANSARYLTGSIDLVYFDGQRYHIADYKSNFLGNDQSHYSQSHIQQSMSHASYWLQAGLYLVALHRYLAAKMQDYQIEQHLGGASYLYLRGMNGQSEQGVYHWTPDAEFILRLDAILGYFAESKK